MEGIRYAEEKSKGKKPKYRNRRRERMNLGGGFLGVRGWRGGEGKS